MSARPTQGARQKGRILMLFLLATLPLPAQAEIKESLAYNYYDVNLQPGRLLYPQIEAAAPRRADGSYYVGHTRWALSWKPMLEIAPNHCALKSVDITLDAVITLPVLHNATTAQKQKFAPFIEALRKHELGHALFGAKTAKELEAKLAKLLPEADCETLMKRADMHWNILVQRSNALEKEYDRITDHGKKDGAYISE